MKTFALIITCCNFALNYGRNRLAGSFVYISGIHEKELKLMKKHFAIAILLILVFAAEQVWAGSEAVQSEKDRCDLGNLHPSRLAE